MEIKRVKLHAVKCSKCKFTVIHSLFFLIMLIFLSCSLGNEVTVYPLICSGLIQEGKCKGYLITGNKSAYKIFPERQTVVHLYPNISPEPMKFTNCAVANSQNWKCTYDDGSGSFGFREGIYWQSSPYEKIIYVSGWRWWYVRLQSFLG